MRSWLVGVTIFLAVSATTYSQNIDIAVQPGAVFPNAQSSALFGPGFGADLTGTVPVISDRVFATGDLGYRFVLSNADKAMSLFTVDAGVLYRQPLGTVFGLEAGVWTGAYLALYGDAVDINPHLASFARAVASLGRSMEVSLGTRYDIFASRIDGEIGSLFAGVGASVGIRIRPGAASAAEPRLEIAPPSLRPVFPVLFRHYDDNAFGDVVIVNEESGRIEDVEIRFFVTQFMDAPRLTFTADQLDRNATLSVPIYALFEDSVLDITEGTSVNAQIQVSYTFRGTRFETSRSETLRIVDRNSIQWDDDRKAAAFVTAKDTNVLRLSRSVAAVVRENKSSAFNLPVRTAIGLFNALQAHSLSYVIDPQSSYEELSQQGTAVDYVQFPSQTLEFQSGDCDDLSVLYAALLESVGIRSAFVTTPGHIYVAFDTNMSQREAERTFSQADRLIMRDGRAWMPVEITLVEDDFFNAWITGARQWREASDAGVANFISVQDAWALYEPTGFEGVETTVAFPAQPQLALAYSAGLTQIVGREIGPQIQRIEDRLAESPEDPRLRNRLGTIHARYGLLTDAEQQFSLAIRRDEYGPALVNLGNLRYLEGNPREALSFYLRAQLVMPEDAGVNLSVARAQYELEQYRLAEASYSVAAELDADLVADYAYIINVTNEAGRAASMDVRGQVVWADEE